MKYKLATLQHVAPNRLPGYLDYILTIAQVQDDEIELTKEQHADIRARFTKPVQRWPYWALIASLFAAPTDQGIGDTIARELGGEKTEKFKRHHEAVFGVWEKPCACAGQVARWNALYPYPATPVEAPRSASL